MGTKVWTQVPRSSCLCGRHFTPWFTSSASISFPVEYSAHVHTVESCCAYTALVTMATTILFAPVTFLPFSEEVSRTFTNWCEQWDNYTGQRLQLSYLSSHFILFDMEQTRWLKSTALSRGWWPHWAHTIPEHSCSGILTVGTRINPDFYRAAQSPESRNPDSLTLSPCLSGAKLQLLAQSLWHIFPHGYTIVHTWILLNIYILTRFGLCQSAQTGWEKYLRFFSFIHLSIYLFIYLFIYLWFVFLVLLR